MATTEFLHVALNCKDPIEVERYYTKHFGFTRGRVYLPGPDQVVVINSGKVALEIFKATKDRPFPDFVNDGPTWYGLRHLAFSVDNLEEKLAEMGEDAKLSMGPMELPHFLPGMKLAWVADPEGNIIELNENYYDDPTPPPLPAE